MSTATIQHHSKSINQLKWPIVVMVGIMCALAIWLVVSLVNKLEPGNESTPSRTSNQASPSTYSNPDSSLQNPNTDPNPAAPNPSGSSSNTILNPAR